MFKEEELDTVSLMLYSYGNLAPLTSDETLDLLKRIENNNNDKDAKDKLLKHNILFLYSKIKGYKKLCDIEDLFTASCEGFINCLNEINTSKIIDICNNKEMDTNHALFYVCSSYIFQSLNKVIKNDEGLAITDYIFKHAKKVRAALKEIKNTFGSSLSYEETINEVCIRTSLSKKCVNEALFCSSSFISLDTPIGKNDDGEDRYLSDTINDKVYEDSFSKLWIEEMKENLNSTYNSLTENQKKVASLAFGYKNKEEMSITDIAKSLSKSRQWVYTTLKETYMAIKESKYDFESYYAA